VTKTRTQLTNTLDTPVASSAPSKLPLFRSFLSTATTLLLTHPEIKSLRDHLEQVDQWVARASLFMEDGRDYQRRHREIFRALLVEGGLFKVDMELCEEVQRRSEYIDWEEKVIRYARILVMGVDVAPIDESD